MSDPTRGVSLSHCHAPSPQIQFPPDFHRTRPQLFERPHILGLVLSREPQLSTHPPFSFPRSQLVPRAVIGSHSSQKEVDSAFVAIVRIGNLDFNQKGLAVLCDSVFVLSCVASSLSLSFSLSHTLSLTTDPTGLDWTGYASTIRRIGFGQQEKQEGCYCIPRSPLQKSPKDGRGQVRAWLLLPFSLECVFHRCCLMTSSPLRQDQFIPSLCLMFFVFSSPRFC